MSRQYVKYKDKWSVFSSIYDGFITEFMSEKDLVDWRRKEYNDYSYPKEQSLRNMEDALYPIRLNRSHEESVQELIEAGFNEKEAIELINNLENKYYKPKERKGKYYCPNCGLEVKYDQDKCNDETCEMELIWR